MIYLSIFIFRRIIVINSTYRIYWRLPLPRPHDVDWKPLLYSTESVKCGKCLHFWKLLLALIYLREALAHSQGWNTGLNKSYLTFEGPGAPSCHLGCTSYEEWQMANVRGSSCETSRVTREAQMEATAGTRAHLLEWLTSKDLTVTKEGGAAGALTSCLLGWRLV